MTIFNFEFIPRRHRAKGLVPTIRRCSKKFREALAAGDEKKQSAASSDAWDAMTTLFEILRGEQDAGNLAPIWMNVNTALIAEVSSAHDQQQMLTRRKVSRAQSQPLSLRNTLNKLAHYETATFRVDGRNSHYLILSGVYKQKYWVAEILVSKLCKNSTAAIQAISS